jgi:hypothetical protein
VKNFSVARSVVRGLEIIQIYGNISLYIMERNCINVTSVGKVSTVLETLKLVTWLILVINLTIVKSGTNFSTHVNLKTHILTHSDKKPFVCSICSEGFCRNLQLKTDTSRPSGKRTFVCGIYGKFFIEREI